MADLKSFPYVFKKYSISYAYSAALLFPKKIAVASDQKSLLAFSYGDTDQVEGDRITLRSLTSAQQELPGSRAEIRAIARFIDGDYYYGRNASERTFKEIAQYYKVLHMAVHGEINNQVPENSRLYFYTQGDSLEDGRLHSYELYNMRLNADFAVLSACNTGSGDIDGSEGIISLGRAFTYAGVNSLLLTRWEVSDSFTPQIMDVFYRELKKGKRKSEALRQAKLEFLEKSDNISQDPFYWGSFYVLGDDSPIEFDDNSHYWKYLLGITVVLLLIGIVVLKRR